MSLTLGSVTLEGFEVPGQIQFGGRQSLAIHQIPGGGRVIDVLGPEDDDVVWSGVLTGPSAIYRARVLDSQMRLGAAVPLCWSGFQLWVIVATLHLNYSNPWWIPYQIMCVVATAPAVSSSPLTNQSSVIADLLTASTYTNVGAAQTAVQNADSASIGTSAFVAAMNSLGNLASTINSEILIAGAAMDTDDLATMTEAAGALASLTAARAYVSRASANLAGGGA